MGMCASCEQSSVPCTQSELSLPTDVLDGLRLLFQLQWQRSAHRGGVAVGPGAVDQRPSGRAVTGLGHGTLPALLSGGIFCRDQTEEFPQCSWGINTCQVANFCHHGNRHGTLHAAQGLQRLAHRGETPGLHVIGEFLLKTLEAFGGVVHRPDVCLQDDVLCRCGADDFREPAQVGRAPVCPAHVPDILSEQERLEPKRGGFAIAHGIFTCPGEVTDGLILHCGDRDPGKVT